MYYYRRNFSFFLRNIPLKRSNIFKNNNISFGNRSFYSNILDNRLKSSLESLKFGKSLSRGSIFPRYNHINGILTKYNISVVSQSTSFSTSSSNIIELSSDDEVPEMTDEAISVEPSLEPKCSSEEITDDTFGTFKGEPLIGKEHGSVYTKHEPTMFGDWSHMGRVTDF